MTPKKTTPTTSRSQLLELVASQDAELRKLRDQIAALTRDLEATRTRESGLARETYNLKNDNARLEKRHDDIARECKRLSDIHVALDAAFGKVRGQYSR